MWRRGTGRYSLRPSKLHAKITPVPPSGGIFFEGQRRHLRPSVHFKQRRHLILSLWCRLDDEDGIMVTGGVDENNQPLGSVEFFSIQKQVSLSFNNKQLFVCIVS